MRAKSHDQRKGQWLINKIHGTGKLIIVTGTDPRRYMNANLATIERYIYNMENDEFDKLMSDYNA